MDDNSGVLADLKRTLVRLEKKLKQNQDYNAYQSLKALVELYERDASVDSQPQEGYTQTSKAYSPTNDKKNNELHNVESHRARFIDLPRSFNRVSTTPRSVIKQKLTELLNERGAPVRLTDILEYFNDTGVNVGGSDPMRNLSAKLSQMDEFESISGKGWYFKRGGDKADVFSHLD